MKKTSFQSSHREGHAWGKSPKQTHWQEKNCNIKPLEFKAIRRAAGSKYSEESHPRNISEAHFPYQTREAG